MNVFKFLTFSLEASNPKFSWKRALSLVAGGVILNFNAALATQIAAPTDPLEEAYGILGDPSAPDSVVLDSYEISPAALAQLRLYGDRAEQRLRRAQRQQLSYAGLRHFHYLDQEIRAAIPDSFRFEGLDPRGDLLLFRAVLRRLVSVRNLLIPEADLNAGQVSEGRILQAGSILTRGIESALRYRENQQFPREGIQRISAPDFVAFAVEQAREFLRMIDTTSDLSIKRELLIRALGWTANTLMRSVRVRELNPAIQSLAGAQAQLVTDPNFRIDEGQQILLEFVNSRSDANSVERPENIGPSLVQRQGLRAVAPVSARGPRVQSLPVVEIPQLQEVSLGTSGGASFGALRLGAGLGGGTSIDQNNQFRGNFGGVAVAAASAGVTIREGGEAFWPDYGASSEVRAMISGGQSRPVFFVRHDAAVNVVPTLPAGFWGAIDANQIGEISEFLVRPGVGLLPMIRILEHDYLLFRIGWQPIVYQFGAPASLGFLNFSFQTVLRLARFFLHAGLSADWNDQGSVSRRGMGSEVGGPNNSANLRVAAHIDASIQSNLLFRGDSITFTFSTLHYTHDAGRDPMNLVPLVGTNGVQATVLGSTTLGAYYGMQF